MESSASSNQSAIDTIIRLCETGLVNDLKNYLCAAPETLDIPYILNSCDDRDYYPLLTAIYNHRHGCMDVLLAHGADPCLAEHVHGSTPLHVAAYKNNLRAAKKLIDEHNINVNARDGWGKTALHHAAYHHNVAMVQVLLKSPNVDTWARDNTYKTPYNNTNHRHIKNIIVNYQRRTRHASSQPSEGGPGCSGSSEGDEEASDPAMVL